MKQCRLISAGVAAAGLALAGPAIGTTAPSTISQLPPAVHAGAVTYVNGGAEAAQADAMDHASASYPLELHFLWGRGAKESEISKVDWSLKNDRSGQTLVDAQATGPIVLASLPDGRYTVTATHDGKTLTRDVDVHKGKHDRVILEWPQ